MRRILPLLAVALAALAAPAAAQQAGIHASPAERLNVTSGSGRLLEFNRPAANIFVANPAVADVQAVSPLLAYVTGGRPGVTDIYAVNDNEQVVASFRVTVAEDAAAANAFAQPLVQSEPVDVSFSGETPVVSGGVRDVRGALAAGALARGLEGAAPQTFEDTRYTGPNQVNLRVRFAEVSRTDVENLGVDFSVLADVGSFAFGIATGSAVAGAGAVAAGFGAAADSFTTLGAGVGTSFLDVDAFLDALASTGAVQVLAEPTLTTVNGREARFLAGGEFPIIVPQGDDTFAVEFREFGVALAFTPTLLPDGRIALEVAPEVSSLAPALSVIIDDFSIPGLTVRRAETTVELASGQTFAIAGLFQRDLSDDLSGVPFFQDLPVLGPLFRSRRFMQAETELVILITPYLVGDTPETTAAATTPRSGAELAGFILR